MFALDSMKLELEIIKNIIYVRKICSLVSIVSCGMVILIYTGLFIYSLIRKQGVKRSTIPPLISKDELQINDDDNSESFNENSNQSISQETTNSKFGLGSHIMFLLMLSNLLWAATSYYVAHFHENGFIYETDKYESNCSLYGFLYNWFDLSIIACTTMLTYIFLKATKKIRLQQQDEKQLFHFSIFYGLLLPLFICLIPFHTDSYGPGVIFCTVDYLRSDSFTFAWMGLMIAFTFGNFFYSFYAMVKVTLFYNEKLKNLKGVNVLEYRMLRVYSNAFISFICVLIVSRCLKEANRIYELSVKAEPYTLLYVDGVCFCLGGTFNAIFCFFFFRGIFSCSNSKKGSHQPKIVYIPSVVINKNSVSFVNTIEFKNLGNDSISEEGIN